MMRKTLYALWIVLVGSAVLFVVSFATLSTAPSATNNAGALADQYTPPPLFTVVASVCVVCFIAAALALPVVWLLGRSRAGH